MKPKHTVAKQFNILGPAVPIALCGGALAAALVAAFFGMSETEVARPAGVRTAGEGAAIWFTPDNRLGAMWRTGNKLRIETSDPDGTKIETVETAAPAEPATVSGDGKWLVWRTGNAIRWRNLEGGQTEQESPTAARPGLAVLDDGTAVAIGSDGQLEIRRPGIQGTETHASNVPSPSMIDGRGSYVVVADAQNWALHRVVSGRWSLVEASRAAAPLTGIWVSQNGAVVGDVDGGVLNAGAIRNTPGPVRARAALPDGGLLVAGEFDGVLLLRPGVAEETVDNPRPRAASIAAAGSYFAYAAGTEIQIRRFETSQALNDLGMRSLSISGILAAGMLAFLIARAVSRRSAWQDRARQVGQEHDFPPELAEALAAYRCTLIGGEGLSVLAGYPSSSEFAARLIAWAETQDLLHGLPAAELRARVDAGRPHEAIDALVAANDSTRSALGEFFREAYGTESRLSAVHAALLDLPFVGVIVGTLDRALDLIALGHAAQPFTLSHAGFGEFAEKTEFYSLRLRGDLDRLDRAFLSRAELAARLKIHSEFRETISLLLKTQTVLFIGMDVDEILALVRHASLNKPPAHTHFAYVPIDQDGRDVQRSEDQLRRYRIEIFPYSRDQGEAALAPMLQALSKKVQTLGSPRA